MSIPANPTVPSPAAAAPVAPTSADNRAAAGSSAPDLSKESIVLIDSGTKQDGSTWQVGEFNPKVLDPHFPKERLSTMTTIADSSLSGRVKMSLSELSDARTSSFMNKIRSLASAIKRIFVSTHPSTGPAQLPPAASKGSRLSYAQTIDTVKANSASDAKRTAQNVLENFAALDQACRKVPDTSRLLKIVSRDQVSDLLLSGSSFNNIVSQARDLQETSGRDKILIAMSHKSGVGFEQKVALQEHVKQELDIIDKVLKQKYEPSNPKLANVCFNQTNPTFADFRTTMENPYQILSSKGSFSTADDKEVRAWLSKGLEVIDTASKAIAATMINHDGSISADAALREFESASSKTL